MKKRVLTLALALCLLAGLIPASAIPASASGASIETASEWARPGIESAIGKGFVPVSLQSGYTSVITRQEFCRMAVKWVEYATGKGIDAVLAERGLSRDTGAFTDTSALIAFPTPFPLLYTPAEQQHNVRKEAALCSVRTSNIAKRKRGVALASFATEYSLHTQTVTLFT